MTTHKTVTKEALVEEIKECLNHPRYGLKESSDTNKNRMNILALIDRYATAQRAEGAREEREEMLKKFKGEILVHDEFCRAQGEQYKECAMCLVERLLTPTETDNNTAT